LKAQRLWEQQNMEECSEKEIDEEEEDEEQNNNNN
jgi:hypothetical protein